MILDGVCIIAAFNSNATLGAPLLPTCIEQPEGGLSSVAFFICCDGNFSPSDTHQCFSDAAHRAFRWCPVLSIPACGAISKKSPLAVTAHSEHGTAGGNRLPLLAGRRISGGRQSFGWEPPFWISRRYARPMSDFYVSMGAFISSPTMPMAKQRAMYTAKAKLMPAFLLAHKR
jgi:hypothetical protein